jgi:hypothetical protein
MFRLLATLALLTLTQQPHAAEWTYDQQVDEMTQEKGARYAKTEPVGVGAKLYLAWDAKRKLFHLEIMLNQSDQHLLDAAALRTYTYRIRLDDEQPMRLQEAGQWHVSPDFTTVVFDPPGGRVNQFFQKLPHAKRLAIELPEFPGADKQLYTFDLTGLDLTQIQRP